MSKSIIIASLDRKEVEALSASLQPEFGIIHLDNVEDCPTDMGRVCAALIDHSFSSFRTRSFISQIKSSKSLPILVMSDEQNAGFVNQAIEDGAYSFIVKKGAYHDIVDFAVRDSIKRYSEIEDLKQLNRELVERIEQMEKMDQGPAQQESGQNGPAPVSASQAVVEDSGNAPVKLNREIMQEIVANLKSGDVNLPSYPGISQKFRLMVSEGESISSLASVLEKDISISSKMISVSNSAYYKGMAPMKTLEQALGRIGMSEAGNYVELIANRSLFLKANEKFRDYLEKLWQHSLACAYLSKELCRKLYKGVPAEFFSLGLLHDMGKLLLIQIISELEVRGSYTMQEQQWKEIIFKYNGQFGASLMKRWKLAPEFAAVSLFHQNPEAAENPSDEIRIIHMADIIAREMGYSDRDEDEIDYQENPVFEAYKLTPDKVEELKDEVEQMMQAGLAI